jgi:hypothetical protein
LCDGSGGGGGGGIPCVEDVGICGLLVTVGTTAALFCGKVGGSGGLGAGLLTRIPAKPGTVALVAVTDGFPASLAGGPKAGNGGGGGGRGAGTEALALSWCSIGARTCSGPEPVRPCCIAAEGRRKSAVNADTWFLSSVISSSRFAKASMVLEAMILASIASNDPFSSVFEASASAI